VVRTRSLEDVHCDPRRAREVLTLETCHFFGYVVMFHRSLVSSKVSGFETFGTCNYGFRQAISPAVLLRHETRHTDAGVVIDSGDSLDFSLAS
jgi:hypothetical protein